MDKKNLLNVWYETQLVGQLWRDELNKIGFRYDIDWLQNGFAISQQLPLTNKEYSPSESASHAFFANLLPEGEARNRIVRNLKITDIDFELLKAIGGECAGALSILPIGHNPNIDVKNKKLPFWRVWNSFTSFCNSSFQESALGICANNTVETAKSSKNFFMNSPSLWCEEQRMCQLISTKFY